VPSENAWFQVAESGKARLETVCVTKPNLPLTALRFHGDAAGLRRRRFDRLATEAAGAPLDFQISLSQVVLLFPARVYPLRFAEEQGHAKYEEMFRNFNGSMTSAASGS
jgi:hypothetical protein